MGNEEPTRALFVSGVPLGIGGIEKSIMEIFRTIDRSKLVIDFIVRKPEEGFYHSEISAYGGRIFNIFEHTKHKGNKKWNSMMDIYSVISFYKILKNKGPFSAVHIVYPHLDGFLIIAAKLAGVPVRIVHSRNTGFDEKGKLNRFRAMTQKIRLAFCKKLSTHVWGCSRAACEYLFGADIMLDKRAEIPQNPVRIYDYTDRSYKKADACKKLDVPAQTINFINVGRYAPQKNHFFLLDVFKELLKYRKDLHLLLTGPGPLEEKIRQYIKELDLSDYVIMLEENTNIPLALRASDYFLLPSIYEGFGNALIEAQASGVPCFVSSVCQPEVNLGLVKYIPLEKGAEHWARYINEQISNPESNEVDLEKLMEFEVSNVASRMQRVYLKGTHFSEPS